MNESREGVNNGDEGCFGEFWMWEIVWAVGLETRGGIG